MNSFSHFKSFSIFTFSVPIFQVFHTLSIWKQKKYSLVWGLVSVYHYTIFISWSLFSYTCIHVKTILTDDISLKISSIPTNKYSRIMWENYLFSDIYNLSIFILFLISKLAYIFFIIHAFCTCISSLILSPLRISSSIAYSWVVTLSGETHLHAGLFLGAIATTLPGNSA